MMSRKTDRVMICGGGTAGHVYPAMAVIEEIKKSSPQPTIMFVGTEKGMESKFIPPTGVEFKAIRASALNISDNVFAKLKVYCRFLFFLIAGFFDSVKLICSFRPQIILGMGGYVCGPLLLAAVILKKRFMLHEQNYIPGRLNKYFSRFAEKVFISFEQTDGFFALPKNRIVFSGNPVRESVRLFMKTEKDYELWKLEKNRFTIVAFGGSLGAGKLNNMIVDLYSHFRNNIELQILLITGKRFYDDFRFNDSKAEKEAGGAILRVIPYVQEMEQVYSIADLIIARAGANTIAEIAITDTPAILIPYPYAIDNHQYYNAKYLTDNGRAILILEKDLSLKGLIDNICGLIEHGRKNYKNLVQKRVRIKKMDSHKIITSYLLGS